MPTSKNARRRAENQSSRHRFRYVDAVRRAYTLAATDGPLQPAAPNTWRSNAGKTPRSWGRWQYALAALTLEFVALSGILAAAVTMELSAPPVEVLTRPSTWIDTLWRVPSQPWTVTTIALIAIIYAVGSSIYTGRTTNDLHGGNRALNFVASFAVASCYAFIVAHLHHPAAYAAGALIIVLRAREIAFLAGSLRHTLRAASRCVTRIRPAR